MGTLVSDAGSVGFYGSMASALATGWSDNIAGHNAVMANYSSRYDNTIAYVSPEFAGIRRRDDLCPVRHGRHERKQGFQRPLRRSRC